MTRRATPPRRARRAFALADVIVGAVILGAALAAIVGLAGQGVTAQRKGQDLATAAMLADEQLNLVLARGPDDYQKRFRTSGRCDEPFAEFEYALDIRGSGESAPYEVGATITWSRVWGRQSLTIRTLVASRIAGEDFDPDPDRRPETPVQRILQ